MPLLTSENIKSCLAVITVVSIEDVTDNHACLPHSSITNQHAAQLIPQSDGFIMSLTSHFSLQYQPTPLSKQLESPESNSKSEALL